MWSDWPSDSTHDLLIDNWYLYQRKGGHRTSTDDVLAAWLAARLTHGKTVSTYVDIGCGVGSVLLMTANRVRPAQAFGIEAQPQSATMALRAVEELPNDAPPITILHGDLRALNAFALPPADLVTGSPPYFPLGTGILSPDPQRQACRFELRGGIEDYCEAAAALLAPDGLFCVVFIAKELDRIESAAKAAGLVETHRSLWYMRTGADEPFLSVHAMKRADGFDTPPPRIDDRGAVRTLEGTHTAEYIALRRFMGWQ